MSTHWCRDCEKPIGSKVNSCPKCYSRRIFSHQEADTLGIAHLDCDAFFASVEKRDKPELASQPVLIGGNSPRSVVATACYIARAFGARSAMSMTEAKRLCPHAVIIAPRFSAYACEDKKIRKMMHELTPLVEPVSIDEAYLDLRGTRRIHNGPPVQILMKLQNKIERELGLGVSIGLSHNRFLAKIASDLDKPRGFSVIGEAETLEFLGSKPPTILKGVGPAFGSRLHRDGLYTLGQIREIPERELMQKYGESGLRLSQLSRGIGSSNIHPESKRKSVSCETTFEQNISKEKPLEKILWQLCEKVSEQAKQKGYAGYTLTLRLKTADHRRITRSITIDHPVQLADTLFRELRPKLKKEIGMMSFRLLGVGISSLITVPEGFVEPVSDLLESSREKRARTELAMDKTRAKFGNDAIIKGRSLPDY